MPPFFLSVKFRVFRGHKCRVHAALSKPRITRNFTDKTAPRPSKSGYGRSLLQGSGAMSPEGIAPALCVTMHMFFMAPVYGVFAFDRCGGGHGVSFFSPSVSLTMT